MGNYDSYDGVDPRDKYPAYGQRQVHGDKWFLDDDDDYFSFSGSHLSDKDEIEQDEDKEEQEEEHHKTR